MANHIDHTQTDNMTNLESGLHPSGLVTFFIALHDHCDNLLQQLRYNYDYALRAALHCLCRGLWGRMGGAPRAGRRCKHAVCLSYMSSWPPLRHAFGKAHVATHVTTHRAHKQTNKMHTGCRISSITSS